MSSVRKVISLILIIAFILSLGYGLGSTENRSINSIKYGVFLGATHKKLVKLKDYDVLVLDGANLSKKQVKKIARNNKEVYSYLNIGSIENFRKYYKEFEHITLGNYENWPEEKWIDVSNIKWQKFVVDKLARDLVDKGVDGFFIDNCDVYYHYEKDEIYNGLYLILNQLKTKYGLKIIVNGGDVFVSKVIESKQLNKSGITGINQESVFSKIDFENSTFLVRTKKERAYYLDYLERLKSKKLEIFILEYVQNNSKLVRQIKNYCDKKNFTYYVSKDVELT